MTDSAIHRGLERQLETRQRLLSSGQKPIGWKAGFGAPAALEKYGLAGPLVGFMTDASPIESGASVDISTWSNAVAEPELAAHIGQDVAPASGEEAARAAIAGLGPAIELADIDPTVDHMEEMLAVNLFHRGVILGPPDQTRQGARLDGLAANVRRHGHHVADTNRLEDLTGRLVATISRLSRLLAGHGEQIRAGEVVICGSIVPPLSLTVGDAIEFELIPLAPISVRV
ncbi:MAG: fumarylacetoacetate hydrolase family protein [Acidimicrobiia bacterium]